MKRPLLIALGAVLFMILVAAWVTFSVASDLSVVKATLSRDLEEIDAEEVEEARLRLQRARERLGSLPARLLRFVPFVGQNLGSLREVVDVSIPTLQAGLDLKDAVDALEERGLIDDGRVRTEALTRLRTPVDVQLVTMTALVDRLKQERNGWLAPPLWEAFDDLLERSQGGLRDARKARELLDATNQLLGEDGSRRYLVLLINNAELRGAGGVLSGVGTVEVDQGRLRLGEFQSVHDLRDHPPRRVPAPSEYERRFGVFDANTTLWLNATYSADVPDVALVASRLYRLKTGLRTDGAFVIDPRGITALLPDDESIQLPRIGVEIPVEDAADFVYSDAYEMFADQETRRDAVLAFGEAVFSQVLEDGLGEDALFDVADATGGGHLRFVSFHNREQAVLEDTGISGELSLSDDDAYGLLITAQNFGSGNSQGTKLDHWARRSISHECEIDEGETTLCTTTTTVANRAPPELPRYVAGNDAVLRNYLETFVPHGSRLLSVRLDDRPVEARTENQAGRTSVAVFLTIPRGESRSIRVDYELPTRPAFEFIVDPQPLTRDARLHVAIRLPSGWDATGSGSLEDGVLTFSGELERRLHFMAHPDRRTGVPRLWRMFTDFWNEPLFR